MNYIKINGKSFDVDVAISKYTRNFNVLDGDNAGRALNGHLVRDIIGTYIGHNVTVSRRGGNYQALDAFWDYLIQCSVDDYVTLQAADGQSTLTYKAYYTSGTQDIEKVENGVNYWGEISVNFIPIDAQVKPS